MTWLLRILGVLDLKIIELIKENTYTVPSSLTVGRKASWRCINTEMGGTGQLHQATVANSFKKKKKLARPKFYKKRSFPVSVLKYPFCSATHLLNDLVREWCLLGSTLIRNTLASAVKSVGLTTTQNLTVPQLQACLRPPSFQFTWCSTILSKHPNVSVCIHSMGATLRQVEQEWGF